MSTTQSLPYFREIMDLIKIIIVELAGKNVIVTGSYKMYYCFGSKIKIKIGSRYAIQRPNAPQSWKIIYIVWS